MQFVKGSKFLVLLFLVSAVIRFWWLDLFPVSMIHDELNYVLNAKSLWHTGKNIPWTASALFSWGEEKFDVVISEIPSVLTAPWIGMRDLNHFNARAPYALISSFSVVLLYLITRRLLANEDVARLTGLVFAVNPWSIHFGRIALEVNFAVFFFLLGTYILLIKSSWKMLWALPLFLASFLSYLGAKLHFLPLVLILLFWKYRFSRSKSDRDKSPFVVFSLLAFLILAFYFLTLNYQPAGKRTGELIFFNQEWSSEIVNEERRQAISNAGLEVFSNKATVILRRIGDVYLEAFSPANLFARGEVVNTYSLWQHGQFYYLDALLIILGLLALFALYRNVFWLIVGIIALSPWVSSIDLVAETFAVRAYPMFPFLALLSGLGFWYIKERLPFGKIIFFSFATIYLGLVLHFFNLYFFRYPIYSAERWFLSERIVSNYAKLGEEEEAIKRVYVATQENAKWVFEEHLFYSGIYEDRQNIERINERMENRDFSWGKTVFLNECPKGLEEGEVLIADRRLNCIGEELGKHGVVDLKDAGTVLIIENDLLCQGMQLERYSRVESINDFHIEDQDKEIFCRNWISKF